MCHLWHNSRYYCVYIWNKVPWWSPAGEGLDLSTDNLFGGTDTDKGVFPTIHHDTIHNFVNFKHPSVVCLGPLDQPYTESLSKSLKIYKSNHITKTRPQLYFRSEYILEHVFLLSFLGLLVQRDVKYRSLEWNTPLISPMNFHQAVWECENILCILNWYNKSKTWPKRLACVADKYEKLLASVSPS